MSGLVVLGGADGAITTLRAARRLGVSTICVDARADAPGAREADRFLHVSTRDVDRIAAGLAGHDIGGVVSPASDVNVPSQVALAHRLGLPCAVSGPALRASVDKGFFRATCDRLGLPGPRFVQGTARRVTGRVRRLTFPVIVKPSDLGGGRGITRCAEPDELPVAVAVAARYSPTGTVIVEEFLRGEDFGMEAVIQDGSVALLGLSRRVFGPGPAFATAGHDMSPGPVGLLDTVRAMLDRVCSALDYRDGALNADVLLTDSGEVVLLEMGARLGGNGVPELLGLVHGVDVTGAFVRMALGERVELRPRVARHAASQAIIADVPGTLMGFDGLSSARGLPEVVEVIVTAAAGDRVEPYTHCRAKLGLVLMVADDPDRLARTVATVGELIRPEIAAPFGVLSGHDAACVAHPWPAGDWPSGAGQLRRSTQAASGVGGPDRA